MSESTIRPTTGTPRWMKITLVVSIAINLGIAGVIGGAALRAPETQRNNLEAPEGIAMLARAMPATHQRELREELRDRRGDLRPDREELRHLRDRFVVALRAEPFDIDAVNEVFADQRDMLSKLTAAGHDSVIEQIEKMSLRDREMYIRRLLGDDRPPPRQ